MSEVSTDQLRQLCEALGWQGGTFWQVLEETQRLRDAATEWIAVKDRPPPPDEPVVYARPHPRRPGGWSVGLAYWTVSQRWHPECESTRAPQGFTHWKPLGVPPHG